MENNTQIIQNALSNINAGSNKIYFYVPQSERFLYRQLHTYHVIQHLREQGKNVSVIHSDQYKKPVWFDTEVDLNAIDHIDVVNNAPTFAPEDIIVAPETDVMFLQELIKNKIPCKVVLMVNSVFQSHLGMNVGISWNKFGIHDIIVTNDSTEKYFRGLYGNKLNIHKIPVSISSDTFKDSGKPKELYVALHTRSQEDFMYIIKTFYNKYPHMRYVSMFDMRQETRVKFADRLERAALAVWVDREASFGTFPIECYRTNTPLLGLMPEITQPYQEKGGTGIWTQSLINIPDMIYQYLVKFQESNLDEPTQDGSKVTDYFKNYGEFSDVYNMEGLKSATDTVFGKLVDDRKNQFADYMAQQISNPTPA